jgi:hypothetical protein
MALVSSFTNPPKWHVLFPTVSAVLSGPDLITRHVCPSLSVVSSQSLHALGDLEEPAESLNALTADGGEFAEVFDHASLPGVSV